MSVEPTPLAPRHTHKLPVSIAISNEPQFRFVLLFMFVAIQVESRGTPTTRLLELCTSHLAFIPDFLHIDRKYLKLTNFYSCVPFGIISGPCTTKVTIQRVAATSENGRHTTGPASKRYWNPIVCSSPNSVDLAPYPRATGVKEHRRPCVSFLQLPDMKLEPSDFHMFFRFGSD